MARTAFRLRLTHKIAAIGAAGVLGLAAVGGIYFFGSATQDRVRKSADNATAMSDLTKKLTIDMLQSRREEKNFLIRKTEQYVTAHADLSKTIDRDFKFLTTVRAA